MQPYSCECYIPRAGERTGQCILRFGRASGLMSPSRTTFSAWSLAAKLKNLDRLILPMGSNSALRRAGAIGERGSTPILSSGRRRRSGGSRRHKAHESKHKPCETTMATVENIKATQQEDINREGADPLIHERPLATVTAKHWLSPTSAATNSYTAEGAGGRCAPP